MNETQQKILWWLIVGSLANTTLASLALIVALTR